MGARPTLRAASCVRRRFRTSRATHATRVSAAATGWGARAEQFPELDQQVVKLREKVRDVDERLDELAADPVVTAQPDPAGWLDAAHEGWRSDRDVAELAAANRAAVLAARDADESFDRLRAMRAHEHDQPGYGHDVDRDGPSFGL